MFRQLPSSTERIMKATDLQRGAGPCGRDFDPLVAGVFLLTSILLSGACLLDLNSELPNLNREATRSNCQNNPDTFRCSQLNDQISGYNRAHTAYSITLAICLLVFSLLLKKNYNKFKINPHHKTAYEFYAKNPQYPDDREETSVHCPILNDDTSQPVFLEITFMDGKKATKAYDYESLKKWFSEHDRDPHTNTNLLDLDKVKEIKFSFDNPEAKPNNTYRRKKW